MYKLKGELKMIGETQQISDQFKKREFVILDNSGQYPQTVLFQAVQDRTEVLDKFKVGDSVEVTFFVRGREWTNPKDGVVKYFNSLDAWKIEELSRKEINKEIVENAHAITDAEDDLPF